MNFTDKNYIYIYPVDLSSGPKNLGIPGLLIGCLVGG